MRHPLYHKGTVDREEKGRSCIGIFILFQRVFGWHGQTPFVHAVWIHARIWVMSHGQTEFVRATLRMKLRIGWAARAVYCLLVREIFGFFNDLKILCIPGVRHPLYHKGTVDREKKGRSCIGIFILFQRVSGWHGQTRLSMLFESTHGFGFCRTDKRSLSVPPCSRRHDLIKFMLRSLSKQP